MSVPTSELEDIVRRSARLTASVLVHFDQQGAAEAVVDHEEAIVATAQVGEALAGEDVDVSVLARNTIEAILDSLESVPGVPGVVFTIMNTLIPTLQALITRRLRVTLGGDRITGSVDFT